MNLRDYESMAFFGMQSFGKTPVVCEAYSGVAIVGWFGNIERQLVRMAEENRATRNFPYANKIEEFLRLWRANRITGSINRESLDVLAAPSHILAVDSWNLANYFSNLRDQLEKLKASEEELPRIDQEEPGAGPGGAGMPRGGSAPITPEFGPEENPPGGLEPMPGEEGEEGDEDDEENANAGPPPVRAPTGI